MTSRRPPLSAFLMTNNPRHWDIDSDKMAAWVEATAAGHPVEGRWSTGSTTKKLASGDRVFLLRQGVKRRGIFASGRTVSDVFQADHWDGSGRLANYADVRWATALDPEDVLPIEVLLAELPEGQWEPQASGTQIAPVTVGRLEQLWAEHVASLRGAPPAPEGGKRGVGQGRRLDATLRKELEDVAQRRLTSVYEADGWHVEDLRVGNPFDAKATRDGVVIYLEAKGTVTDGARVIVTRGEVDWARDHPGECVIGVLSDVTLKEDGTIDDTSGALRQYHWEPADDDLVPLQYDFHPPAAAELK